MAGRITITDVVLTLFGIAVLAGLYPVYQEFLGEIVEDIDPVTAVAFQVVVPLAVVIMAAMLAGKALGGSS